ncbi:hypothetical protein FLT43_06740 [Paenibacillus thiaminolyticus]|uniref:Tc1-like transposase DDE domain-containing protein n=1 Tax=Paenibacillus thiaminolyticus TaxID=49283 RepID=A0AAP9DS94_PANTH|nr:hypothetical protein FLT43_06740 [Paenibacillus thiaminolyticus]
MHFHFNWTPASITPPKCQRAHTKQENHLLFPKKGAPVCLQVVAPYPTGQTVMVLDNARIHHATLLQSFSG